MSESSVEQQKARFLEDPDASGAFEFLEEAWFMQEDWAALADLYRRRLAAPSLAERPRQRAQIAMRLGQVLEERLADEEAAIRSYTEALHLDPQTRPALQYLRRIYARRESWEAVLQIAEQELTLARTNEERAQLYTTMGDVWLRELEDEAQAEQLYARARSERGASADAEEAPAEPPAPDSLVQSAWLCAARGENESALAMLRRALEQEPENVEALDMALAVLEGAERHEEMAELLARRAALATDPETRATVLVRLGALREHLGDPAARDTLEEALATCPGHAGAREALRHLYRSAEAWGPLRALLEDAVAGSSGPARVEFLYELAGLLDRQYADPEGARARLQEAAQLAPEDPRLRLLRALESRGEAAGSATSPDADEAPVRGEQRATRVVGLLQRKLADLEARAQGTGAEACRMRLRIGELQADSLGDPAAAVTTLEPALDDDATLVRVAPLLARLYDRLGRLDALAALAERAGSLSGPTEQRTDWFRRAAETSRAVGDPTRAIRCYQSLLAETPQDATARAALCDLYRSRGDAGALAELLRSELPRADESRELEIHLELARICSDSLNDPAGALAHLRRALELEPTGLDLLDAALELCGGPLDQLVLLELAVEGARDDAARARLLARWGTLLATALEWKEEAAARWRDSLALDPDQPELRAGLETPAA